VIEHRVAASSPVMVRRSRASKITPWVLAAVDVLLIYLAFVSAYWIRYELKLGRPISTDVPFSNFQPLALLLLGVMMPVLVAKGAYRQRMSREGVDELTVVLSSSTITIAAIVVFQEMSRTLQYSRGVVVYVWVLMILFISVGRTVFRRAQAWLHGRGVGVRRLLVVGASDVGKMVMQSVMNRPDLGYKLVGFVEHRPSVNPHDFGRFRALGSVADVPPLVQNGQIDEIIVALPASAHKEVWSLLGLCEQHGVGLKLVPDLFEMSLSRVQFDQLAGIPLLDVQDHPLRTLALGLKRAVDIAGSFVMLVVTAPLVAIIAAGIRMDSPGPILLRQTRVGLRGKPFTCLKFRTMHQNALQLQDALWSANNADGPLFKMRDDPRLTRLGKYLRRLSFDELPQAVNVLRGDMSLVGPRPALPMEVEAYEERHRHRLEVKPGMTGIWQVSGRSDLGFEEMVVMDSYYVDKWNVLLDVKILLRTVLAVLGRNGAY